LPRIPAPTLSVIPKNNILGICFPDKYDNLKWTPVHISHNTLENKDVTYLNTSQLQYSGA